MFRTFNFFLREVWATFTRTPFLSFSFITQFSVSLIILGLFLISASWLNSIFKEASSFYEIRAYLSPSVISEEQINHLEKEILKIPGVVSTEYFSSESALVFMKEQYHLDIQSIFGGNPLPSAFRIRIQPEAEPAELAKKINLLNGIEETDYTRREEFLLRLKWIVLGGQGLALLVLLALGLSTLFTVINTIRLSVYARRREIKVMEMVGASDWFIRWPFILEGLAGGVLSTFLSLAIVMVIFGSAWKFAWLNLSFLPLPDLRTSSLLLGASLFLFAILVGGTGSYFAVNRFLGEVLE